MKRFAIKASIAVGLGLGLTLALLWLLGGGSLVTRAQGPDGEGTYYVALSCTDVPTPCHTTVQAAVDAADDPGDVLVVSSAQDRAVALSAKPYATNVMGIYSTNPGFVGGRDLSEPHPGEIPVAISGIVPCKVSAENGPIKRGDLLTTSSTPGHAMKAEPIQVDGTEFYLPGAIVGKALEELYEGTGVILVLVTLQ